ncbi:hypothetical protein BU17DRAFT_47949 [Hysterangium stoloniferum]|nr:hypothetical protein BU17DRAFT_47949 [Hysterangium stoloniferum]
MLSSLVARRPALTLLPVTCASAFFSLSLTPSFISLIFLLTTLLLYTRTHALGNYAAPKIISVWITLTVSIATSHLRPSISALSSPLSSVASLSLLSASSSIIALIPIVSRNSIRLGGSRAQMFVFPVLWTMTWLVVSRLSPLGRLVTWTPLSGITSYQWLRRYLGFSGIDFVTAMWASVAAEGLGNMIAEREEESPLINLEDDNDTPSPVKRPSGHLVPSIVILLALALPSFYVNPLPLPPISEHTTAFKVACILPPSSEASQLTRFLDETKHYTPQAKILIWPESAVTFETSSEKTAAFEAVQQIASSSKTWIGVSFQDGGNKSVERRSLNGFRLIGPDSNQEEIVYYKRNLVPIAESFSQTTPGDDPVVYKIDVPIAGEKTATQPISLSASICLDFSTPLTALTSRPELVLAPANTWHVDVGRAMYQLARARGEEIGAEILWCDGGKEGLSGVAGDVQVGPGSWVKTIGVPSPANDSRTVYGACGDWLPLALLLGIFGSLWIVQDGTPDIKRIPVSVIAWSKLRIEGIATRVRAITGQNQRAVASEQPLLINTSD